jgi:alpha-tubulin suppressor-like RCC1 family protein
MVLVACNVDGTPAPSGFTVSLAVDRNTVFEGEGAQASVQVTDDAGRNVTSNAEPPFYSSSNPGVATINPLTGAITAVSAGQAWIGATVLDPRLGFSDSDSLLFTVQRRPVATVRVVTTGSSLPEGYQATVTAIPLAGNGDTLRNRFATFVSSDTTILRTGVVTGSATTVTALRAGQATVAATIEGVTGSQSVTVTPPVVSQVSATLTPTTVSVGGKATITVIVRDTGGRTVTSGVSLFGSSNTTVATVAPQTSRSAAITAVSSGSATIRATFGGVSDSVSITVLPAPTVGIRVTATNPQQPLYPTRTAAFTAVPVDSAGNTLPNRPMTISIRHVAVATATQSATNPYSATVTGVGVGSTYLVASSGAVTDSVPVRVVTPPLAQLTITLPAQLNVGQTSSAGITGLDAIGGVVPNPSVTWESRNPTVASVSPGGLVTGVAPGTTDIIASASDSVADTARVVVTPGTNLPAKFIATGEFHTVVIDTSGVAYSAGANTSGQLGRGTATTAEVTWQPLLSGTARYKQASLGSGHTVLLTNAGAVKTVGRNFAGQLGNGNFTDRSTLVDYQIPEPAVRVRAGGDNTCAIGANSGHLYCSGQGAFGQLGTQLGNEHTPQLVWNTSRVSDVTIGSGFICITTESSTDVWCRGRNLKRQVDQTGANVTAWTRTALPPQSGVNAVSYTLPTFSQAILLADNMATLLNAGHESWCFAPWQGLAVGGRNTQVFCQGDNQLRDVSDAAATPVSPGQWRNVPVANFGVAVPGVEVVRRGFQNTQVLTTSGVLLGVGYNFFGQMGNGTFTNVSSWVEMAPGRTFRKLAGSALANHSCAIDASFAAWCWGRNEAGQLGIGKLSVRETTPVMVRLP